MFQARCLRTGLGSEVIGEYNHLYYCDHCAEPHYRCHSCRNRHCPQCQRDQAEAWLARQQAFLLPVPYFMATFTLPQDLCQVARSHQQVICNLLFRTFATALQELALDPRFVGGQIGLMEVLQTWTRQLLYRPRVHYLVTGGGVASDDDQRWQTARPDFLVHVKPLFRGGRTSY